MSREICLVASGDSRLPANRVCWPAQEALEAAHFDLVLNRRGDKADLPGLDPQAFKYLDTQLVIDLCDPGFDPGPAH